MKPKYAPAGINLSKRGKDDSLKQKVIHTKFETISHDLNIRKRCRTRNEKMRSTISQHERGEIKFRPNDPSHALDITVSSIESRKL